MSARKPLVLPSILGGRGSNKGGMLSPRADHPHHKPRSRTPTGTLNTSLSSEYVYSLKLFVLKKFLVQIIVLKNIKIKKRTPFDDMG